MDGMQQIVIPVLGIVAAAAVTFYAVSFSELSEKSFRELDEKVAAAEEEGVKFQPNMSSRERRARKKADKKSSS